ncbi:DUF6349 family protein [Galactobacter valiniphilus]|uniref:DUF6349 family protein n=1 Tax=Galactobacter valiniphilus TaxID=2676122 RepID=UPI0037362B4C
MTAEQLDLLDLLAALEAPAPAAPAMHWREARRFMHEMPSCEELEERNQAWVAQVDEARAQNRAGWLRYYGWRPGVFAVGSEGLHSARVFISDTRCLEHGHDRDAEGFNTNLCVGSYLARIYCINCDWWTDPCDGENGAAEAFNDHCWPGWRDLPVLTKKSKGMGHDYGIPADYPEEWKVPGAPTVDWRTPGSGRHVPVSSYANPFNGYSMARVREETA